MEEGDRENLKTAASCVRKIWESCSNFSVDSCKYPTAKLLLQSITGFQCELLYCMCGKHLK